MVRFIPLQSTSMTEASGLVFIALFCLCLYVSDTRAQENTIEMPQYSSNRGNAVGASATVAIQTPGGINASTFNSGSFLIENTSTNSQKIESVTIDLRSAILPNMVFDPFATAGDVAGKDFTIDQGGGATGFSESFLEDPQNGIDGEDGYGVIRVTFNDFDPGETFTFSIDVDPTSIKGTSAPGPNDSGSVSGLELMGSTFSIDFDDETLLIAQPFREPSSVSSSLAMASENTLGRPIIGVRGISKLNAVIDELAQTVRVHGPVGETARLVILEAGLYLPNGSVNAQPFEANSIIGVQELEATISGDGFVDFSVLLTDSGPESGYNYMMAVLEDEDGNTGLVSDVVVMNHDPENTPNQVIRINAGGASVVSNDISWLADQYFSGGGTFINTGFKLESTITDEIYYSERFDSGLEGLTYNIPVPQPGTYIVDLHFAEIFFGAPGVGENFGNPGQRIFSVDVEGRREVSDLDMFAVAGPASAIVRTINDVSVIDGFLTIEIVSSIREGKLSAIEVSSLDAPLLVEIEPQTVNFYAAEVGGSSLPRSINITNGSTETRTISTVNITGTHSSEFVSSFSVPVEIPGSSSTLVEVFFQPISAGTKSAQLEVQFGSTEAPIIIPLFGEAQNVTAGNVLYRVNAGGRALPSTDGLPIWTEDLAASLESALGQAEAGTASPYVNVAETGDLTFGSLEPITLDASVPSYVPMELFQTERLDLTQLPNLQWEFPVEAGTEVEIRVFLAELFLTDTSDSRIFDILINGFPVSVFNDINIFEEFGHDIGVMKTFTTLSDGLIQLEFDMETASGIPPSIQGIEIVSSVSTALPQITSTPELNVALGNLYTYDVEATGIPLPSYALITAPPGMTIDTSTGVISWSPDNEGSFNVTVRATNSEGFDEQSFTVTVIFSAQPPAIISTPELSGTVGALFSYDVDATGDPLPTFSLQEAPIGMSIDAGTGIIAWTPTRPGRFTVTVVAANGTLPNSEQTFSVIVSDPSFSITREDRFADFTENTSYRMISIPGNIDFDIASTLQGAPGRDWNAFFDNGANEDYFIPYLNSDTRFRFRPGRGFWVLSRTNWSVSAENVSAVQLDENGHFVLDVHEGWNIIASPFQQPVSWESVREANNLEVTAAVYAYDSRGFNESTVLEPFKGYYFDSNNTTLRIPHPSFDIGSKQSSESPLQKITISALDTQGRESSASIVFWDEAEQGRDQFDQRTPRNNFNELALSFLIEDNIHDDGTFFTVNAHPLVAAGVEFDMAIIGVRGTSVTFEIEGIDLLSEVLGVDAQVVLSDLTTGQFFNFGDSSPVAFDLHSEYIPLRVTAGSLEYVNEKDVQFVSEEFAIKGAFPNPFNAFTNLAYSLPEESFVEIYVYDVLGRQVRILEQKLNAAGRYSILWDGKDASGSSVSSGMYIIQLRINHNQRQSISLLKVD